jgi:PAS domain S-box-containing protein
VAQNITERKRAEQALRKSEQEYHNLFELANDAVLIFDPEGEIVLDVNHRACDVYGIPRERFLGTSLKDLSQDPQRGEQYLRTLFAEGACQGFESVQYRANGSPIDLLINASLVEFQGRHAVLSINRDITERKHAEQVQELAIIEEREWIAREMHDSVAQVLGYVNMKAEAARELLGRGQADRAAAQIEQLAEAARSAYTDVREDILALRTSTGLRRPLADTLRDYLEHWQDLSGVPVELLPSDTFTFQLSPTAELQLVRIIQEALTNVRKHAHAERATVRFSDTAGGVEVVVEDDGGGFDPKALQRGPFPRFGLATMRERAEACGGALEIDSAPGRGTWVKVYLPTAPNNRCY